MTLHIQSSKAQNIPQKTYAYKPRRPKNLTNSCICDSSHTILEGTNQLVSESPTSSPKTIPLLHIHPIHFYSFIFIIQKNFRQVDQYFNQGIALIPYLTPISTQPRQAWLHIHPRLQARFFFVLFYSIHGLRAYYLL